jgi:aspartyl-tRNA(Asn)/glutamyl-tRNA(Gln) amidotransferase subunit B
VNLFRRKLWGDRFTWLVVAGATVFVVMQYLARHGHMRLYILYGWTFVVACLVFFSELRIGRRKPQASTRALYTGWAAFVGEERIDPSGQRFRGWAGTAPGVLSFEPAGLRWTPLIPDHGPDETLTSWPDVYSWRLVGVVPLVWRASGYLWLSMFGGRELVFHVHAVRRWRKALREAMIVGATHGTPSAPPAAAAAEVAPLPAAAEAEPMGEELAAMADAGPRRIFSEETYEPVIGIECHVELDTRSKMFCGCPTTFGASPNSHVCEVCSGQPGALPVPNREAIDRALKIALALNCSVTPQSLFHRKNYFYPDMPKNYQISQYDVPLAKGGYLDYELDGETKRVGIERVHIEEDTGKTIHAGESGRIGVADYALIDYNRAGIPLVEIVTEPDLHSPEEARAYVSELRSLLLALGVSDVRMEEGSLRCDANVSVRPEGSSGLGTKTEVKNMNSLRSLVRALHYEVERQSELLRSGEDILQETRHFDESRGVTIGGRAKEYSSDYRYFPDPDLVPLAPDAMWINEARSSIPELPASRRHRFVTDYGLTDADARALSAAPGVAGAFEEAVKAYGGPARAIARWYLGELAQLAGEAGAEVDALGVPPPNVAELQRLIDDGKVSDTTAKSQLLKEMASTGRAPATIVEEAGLTQISDESQLQALVDEVIGAHPDVVEQIRSGKSGAVNFLTGQVMKQTRGQANPEVVGRLLAERLQLPAS